MDVENYFSCRLVTVPTVVSVDAFVTPSAAVRRGSKVVYVGETSPDPLIIPNLDGAQGTQHSSRRHSINTHCNL